MDLPYISRENSAGDCADIMLYGFTDKELRNMFPQANVDSIMELRRREEGFIPQLLEIEELRLGILLDLLDEATRKENPPVSCESTIQQVKLYFQGEASAARCKQDQKNRYDSILMVMEQLDLCCSSWQWSDNELLEAVWPILHQQRLEVSAAVKQ